MEEYDLIIIGAGPAGLTAGIYAARSGLKTAIISKDIGGTTNSILVLENWPGYTGSGPALMKQFHDQLKKYPVKFIPDEVTDITKTKEFIIKTRKQTLKSKILILSTGTERRRINIKGEKDFVGKGVSYCVTCDSFFFKDKIVAVIGGSDCAATSALALADIAKKVYIVYRGQKLRCEIINSERLEKHKNVEILYGYIPVEIKGKNKVESLIIKNKTEKNEIKLDGIFVEIGATAITEFTKNLKLKLDKEKYIVVDQNMNTSIPGLFAAGDVTDHKLKQVIVSSGQGAIAAKSAYDYFKK